ncbi:MAG: hypothetical protein ABIH23_03330 [bacterium]
MPKSEGTPEKAFALMEKAELAIEQGADPETITKESLLAEPPETPQKANVEEKVDTTKPATEPKPVEEGKKPDVPKVDELSELKQKYSSLLGRIEKELKPVQELENKYGTSIKTLEPYLDLITDPDPKFRNYILKFDPNAPEVQKTEQQVAEEENVDWDDPKQRQTWLDRKLDENISRREQTARAMTKKQRDEQMLATFQTGLKSSTVSALDLAGGDQTKVDAAMKSFFQDFVKGDLAKYAVAIATMDERLAAAREEGKKEGINSIKTKLPNSQTVARTAGADGRVETTETKTLAEMDSVEEVIAYTRSVKPFSEEWKDACEKAELLAKRRSA